MTLMKLLILLLICLWLYFLWRRRKYYMLAFKIRGPWGYPLIGMVLEMANNTDFLKILKRYEELYNNFGLTWVGPIPFLIVSDPQIVQDIFTSPHCVNRSDSFGDVGELIGNGLLALRDTQWLQHRKLLNPAFKTKVLTSFFPIFNEESNKLLRTLDDYCGCGEIDLTDILKFFTLTLTTRTMMDCDVNDEMSAVIKTMPSCYDHLIEIIYETIMFPWLKPAIVRKLLRKFPTYAETKLKIEKFVRSLIDSKITANRTLKTETFTQDENNNFINVALKLYEEGIFTYKNVVDESHVMVVASFETTTNTVLYTLILLAMFPEYQEKLFEELFNFYPDRDNLLISPEDIQNLVYLDMVVNEVMRLLAPVPFLGRHVSTDIELSNGIVLPKGLQIGVDIFNMQRRKDLWGPAADIFNPENFLPSNLEGKYSYAFMPFSKGQRHCIGWRYAVYSMKVVLIKLIRNYYFQTDFKFEELEFVFGITLKLKNIPKLKIFRRD